MSGGALPLTPRGRSDVALGWRLVDALVWAFRALRLGRLGRGSGYALLIPGVLVVGVLAASLVRLTWMSLHDFDPYLYTQGGWTTANFREVIESEYYRNIMLRTLGLSAGVTVVALVVAMPFAYTMVRTRNRWARLALIVVVFLPFLVGEVVRAYGWLVMIGGNGAIAWVTDLLGLGSTRLLGTPTGVALGLLQLMLPLCVLTLLPAMHAIDPDLEDAASVMGARPRHAWRHVIVPLARPGLAAAAAVSFSLSMTAFATPALLGNGQYDFIANTIQLVYFRHSNSYVASAMGILVLIAVTVGVMLIFLVGNARGVRRARAAPAPMREPA